MGFNNDKYIIYICGYSSSWYDYKIGFGDTELNFDIGILMQIFQQIII